MPLSVILTYEVRTTGDDLSAGAFNPYNAPANLVDYSQQDAAQYAYTDLVIGNPATKLSSVARPFVAADVGNCVRVNAGTNFTTGLYYIASVAGGVATMDRVVGTIGATGGTGRLGGAIATLAQALSTFVDTSSIWMRGGTYNMGSTLTLPSNLGAWQYNHLFGYGTTRGDKGKPVINWTGGASTILNITGLRWHLRDLLIDGNNAATAGVQTQSGADYNICERVYVKRCFYNLNVQSFLNNIYKSTFELCKPGGANIQFAPVTSAPWPNTVEFCTVRFGQAFAGGGDGIIVGDGNPFITRCLIYGNQGNGINLPFVTNHSKFSLRAENNVIWKNGVDGISLTGFASQGGAVRDVATDGLILRRNVIGENTNFDIGTGLSGGLPWGSDPAGGTAWAAAAMSANAYYTTGVGKISGATDAAGAAFWPAGPDDITLTADPFVDSVNGNFAYNAVAGGGLLLTPGITESYDG